VPRGLSLSADIRTERVGRGQLIVVLGVSGAILVAELIVGLLANSLAVLADAAHVLVDVVGTGIALAAVWFAARPATRDRTFGFYRFEILAAVLNAVLLFAIAAYVLVEAARRLSEPPEIAATPMILVAAAALLGNALSAWVMRAGRQQSLNMRAAYLEVVNDMLGAAAVLIAGVVIAVTGFGAADALASGLIGLLILPRTWSLLREAVDILLEATPRGVDMDEVRRHVLEAPGVRAVHDLHAWTITSGMNVVSAHVIIDETARPAEVLDHLCRCLESQFDIEHSTFQVEAEDRTPREDAAHR
jgi:cobalt-zinc-cadmium efflux system protein